MSKRTVVFHTNVISLQFLYTTIFVARLLPESVKGTLSHGVTLHYDISSFAKIV